MRVWLWGPIIGVLLGVLSGCQSVGTLALHTANVIAAAGPHQRHADLAYGEHERQRLDIYTPTAAPAADRDTPRPVVVFIHGGKWSAGYPDKDAYRFVGDALTAHGCVAVLPNYRLYPEVRFPAFVEDAADAVAWTRKHIEAYGGDRDAVFVMGHSAGAHIAAMLATDDAYLAHAGGGPDTLRGMIGVAGPYTFFKHLDDPELEKIFGPPTRYPLSQPVSFVDAADPPMLLLYGEKDDTVPPELTERMARRVREAGGHADLIAYAPLNHVMSIGAMAMPVRMHHSVAEDIADWVHARHAEPRRGYEAMFVAAPSARGAASQRDDEAAAP